MQRLAANMPHSVGSRLKALTGLKESDHIDWVSPAPNDRAEFRDAAFLQVIGHQELREKLRAFWPKSGPQWDGLAVCGEKVILVEAKAHVAEMQSNCMAGPKSLLQIESALAAAAKYFGAADSSQWTRGYYQYANRLAHLYFLASNGVDAHLVFVYFTNADMNGPRNAAEWATAIEQAHTHLGLPRLEEHQRVHDLFVDAGELV
jgi:hypothetical protein